MEELTFDEVRERKNKSSRAPGKDEFNWIKIDMIDIRGD